MGFAYHIRTLHFDTRRAVHYNFLSVLARLAGQPNLGQGLALMQGVAPQTCDQVTCPLLGGEAGGRSPGFVFGHHSNLHRLFWADGHVIDTPGHDRQVSS
jgi:hypothetical protein